MQQLAFLLTHNVFPLVTVQKVWAKPRAAKFWEEACQGLKDQDWEENFQIAQVAFEYLTVELSPIISKRDTNFHHVQYFCISLLILQLTIRLQTFLELRSPPSGKSMCRYAMSLCKSFF